MPASRLNLPVFSSGTLAPAPAAFRASGEFGNIGVLARAVAEHTGIAVVIGPGTDGRPGADAQLIAALHSRPDAAFAFGPSGHGPRIDPGPPGAPLVIDPAALIARPTDIGVIAIRASQAARLGWPDFGPPDLVLDAAATWALAAALTVRGGVGLFVPGAPAAPGRAGPGPIDRLRPEGVAWLVACALSWGPAGGPTPDLAGRLWRRWTHELAAAGFDGLTPPAAPPR